MAGVVDNTGASIRWEWRAARFADYLLQTRLKSRNNGLRVVYSITINLGAEPPRQTCA